MDTVRDKEILEKALSKKEIVENLKIMFSSTGFFINIKGISR